MYHANVAFYKCFPIPLLFLPAGFPLTKFRRARFIFLKNHHVHHRVGGVNEIVFRVFPLSPHSSRRQDTQTSRLFSFLLLSEVKFPRNA